MGYKEAKINFYPDRITYIGNKLEGISEEAKQEIEDRLGTDFSLDDYLANESEELIIMMSWEHPVMQRSAEFVCENGGDILEIGFGMGIASDYIQSYNPNSHTIIEMHPELAEKAREWASNKVNVTIIEGDWIEEVSELGKFDGIFFDAYGVFGHWGEFASSIANNTKEGCHITFWNASNGEFAEGCGFDDSYNITYERIDVEPDPQPNPYYLFKSYLMPKVVV